MKRRANELADFVTSAATHYGFARGQVVATGFSNGANIGSAMLLLRPETLTAAILFRAMVALVPDTMPALPDTPVFLSNGRQDPIVAAEETERLAGLLRTAGADVTLAWQPGGHQLTPADIASATAWLAAH